jgi:ABC-type multidrug transport system fused ATPase/permease subunit
MRALPFADPGEPDHRSASRYLWWLARRLAPTLIRGMCFGILWMLAPTLIPATIGKAIDAGLAGGDFGRLLEWAGVLAVLGLVEAWAGILRHRTAVFNWLAAAYLTVQVTARQATRLGATLPRLLATGEVVSIGTSDIEHLGNCMDIIARGSGALVAVVAVAVILVRLSGAVGLVVVLGVPVLMVIVGLLIRPLHRRQHAYRELQAELATRATDIVTGLRVLRGVGGEAAFADRYAVQSQALRAAGVRVGGVDSYLEAAQVLLPGVFVVLVTWLGGRLALAGRLTAGELVACYGYAAFLIGPLRTLTEAVDKFTRGHVSARRVCRVLSLRPDLGGPREVPPAAAHRPPAGGALFDPESGLTVHTGRLTALAAAEPRDAALLADRLGRYQDSQVTLGGVALAALPIDRVRETILVADNDARLFSGTLRTELDPHGRHPDERIRAALAVASGTDILDALPDGLDAAVAERGREFSGGQQQRLRLARALLADPPVLVLVEPTSAVDAHTEARIAARLRAARAGRTTVLATTSPLLLDRADTVVYVEDGKVVAEGTHRELLAGEPRYAATVTRGEA